MVVTSDDASHCTASTAQTLRFLSVVNPEARTWQTFDDKRKADGKPRRDPGLVRVLHGDFAKHKGLLRRLNDPNVGAGIYITGSLTDGRGRRDSNIADIVVIVADLDHGQIRPWPIGPTFIIETSPGKLQVWWVLDQGLTREQHHRIMQRLVADYGADPAAVDVARVYRVPGFLHLKREPFMVRIIGGTMQPVPAAEVIAAFPPLPSTAVRRPDVKGRSFGSSCNQQDLQKLVAPLKAILADDYLTWITVGLALHAESGGSDEGLALFEQWSGTSEKYRGGECGKKWGGFGPRDGPCVGAGTIFFLAKQHGWQPNRGDRKCPPSSIAMGLMVKGRTRRRRPRTGPTPTSRPSFNVWRR